MNCFQNFLIDNTKAGQKLLKKRRKSVDRDEKGKLPTYLLFVFAYL